MRQECDDRDRKSTARDRRQTEPEKRRQRAISGMPTPNITTRMRRTPVSVRWLGMQTVLAGHLTVCARASDHPARLGTTPRGAQRRQHEDGDEKAQCLPRAKADGLPEIQAAS